MDKEQLIKDLKSLGGRCFFVEAKLPYKYGQHDNEQQFLAEIRQRLYNIRCSLGSIEETVKDERNWS